MSAANHLQLDLPIGSAPVARPQFADLMARMASTVNVVSAGRCDQRVGRTATAVLSLSADPPSVVVSIRSGSDLAAAITREGGFSVAMLSEGQELIGDAFAGRVPPASRFLLGIWSTWSSGRPCLLGASAAYDCVLGGIARVADHDLFIGIVTATEVSEHRRPLLWSDRAYQSLKSFAHPAAVDAVDVEVSPIRLGALRRGG